MDNNLQQNSPLAENFNVGRIVRSASDSDEAAEYHFFGVLLHAFSHDCYLGYESKVDAAEALQRPYIADWTFLNGSACVGGEEVPFTSYKDVLAFVRHCVSRQDHFKRPACVSLRRDAITLRRLLELAEQVVTFRQALQDGVPDENRGDMWHRHQDALEDWIGIVNALKKRLTKLGVEDI